MKRTLLLLLSTFLLLPLVAQPAHAPQGRMRQMPHVTSLDSIWWGVHDPVMCREGDTYYLFATGMGISVASSKDMMNWTPCPAVFDSLPAWITPEIPSARNHLWAPDVLFYKGKYHLFYACSLFGKNTSVMGHATNVTLDATRPDYHWEDCGMVVRSVPGRDRWNAIDPNVVIDADSVPWMSFGSFWDGIKMFRLNDDLSAPATPQEWYTVCSRRGRRAAVADPADSLTLKAIAAAPDAGDNAVEAPFVFCHDGRYYLFVSFDYCCRGLDSNYKIAVGRSDQASHGYVDRDGIPLDQGGGTVLVEGDENLYAGVGHCAVYTFDGKDYLIAHAYDRRYNGRSVLYIRELLWDADGWPLLRP